jgi:hypothetical protein
MVVEPSPAPDIAAVPPQPEPAPAAPEIAPANESAEGKKE